MEHPLLSRLRETLEARKKKNPRFSLRAFAKQLGVPAPTLSRLLAGQWKLTLAMARRIVAGLSDDFDERRRMLKAFAVEPERTSAKPTRYRHLTLKELERLSHWGHGAVLEWLRGKAGVRSVADIARATGLSETETQAILEDLLKMKCVSRTIKHGWISKGLHLSSIRWEGEAAWRKVHQGYASLAASYIEKHEKEKSTIQGITLLVAPERLAEAREKIRQFAEELSDELASEEGGALYRLNIQLFPMGK